ncbi:unnamed protein product [Caenorhabditis sp. 36 PRJEB53466]|nr:unnamed protein product [Caenorhabditis sp. 36 PRJEB53466]
MAENEGFVHDEITVTPANDEKRNENQSSTRKRSVDIGTSTTQIIIESEPPVSSRDCWSSMCDVFGTRQSAYIAQLRPISAYLLRCQEALKIFQYELERDIKTKQTALATYQHVMDCVIEINHICMHRDLNIPPEEHTMLRSVAYELALLARIIEEVANQTGSEKPRSRTNSFQRLTISAPTVHTSTEGDETRDIGSGGNIPAVDEGSLKETISNVFDMIENLMKYIDKKTERRWWLRDVINFTQAAVKVALFISAAISVAYHENQIAPIITLIITCIQGITEGFDQYFLKNKSPDDIHISVLTNTMNNLKMVHSQFIGGGCGCGIGGCGCGQPTIIVHQSPPQYLSAPPPPLPPPPPPPAPAPIYAPPPPPLYAPQPPPPSMYAQAPPVYVQPPPPPPPPPQPSYYHPMFPTAAYSVTKKN